MANSRLISNSGSGKRRANRGEAQSFYTDTVLAYEGDECLIWPFARTKGGYANLSGDYVHRKICEETNGPAPTSDHEAAHSCGKGKSGCVTKGHLSWKTHLENETDKLTHGTRTRGIKHGRSRLTEAQIVDILTSKEMGITLARKYGVSNAHITNIRKGAKWGWLLPAEKGTDRSEGSHGVRGR